MESVATSGTGHRVHKWVEGFTWLLAMVAGLVLMLLMLLTVADVFMRYFLNAPIRGVWDLTQAGMVVITSLGLAYCGSMGAHIALDLVVRYLPRRARRIVDVIVGLTGASVMFVVAWTGFRYAAESMRTGASSMTILMPLYPFIISISFGCLAFGVVLAIQALWGAPERDQPQSAE